MQRKTVSSFIQKTQMRILVRISQSWERGIVFEKNLCTIKFSISSLKVWFKTGYRISSLVWSDVLEKCHRSSQAYKKQGNFAKDKGFNVSVLITVASLFRPLLYNSQFRNKAYSGALYLALSRNKKLGAIFLTLPCLAPQNDHDIAFTFPYLALSRLISPCSALFRLNSPYLAARVGLKLVLVTVLIL